MIPGQWQTEVKSETAAQTKEMLMLAKQELHSAQYATYKSTQLKNAAVSVKNEVMKMIAKVRERKGRLDLPIVSGKHLRRISDRTALQSADNAVFLRELSPNDCECNGSNSYCNGYCADD